MARCFQWAAGNALAKVKVRDGLWLVPKEEDQDAKDLVLLRITFLFSAFLGAFWGFFFLGFLSKSRRRWRPASIWMSLGARSRS